MVHHHDWKRHRRFVFINVCVGSFLFGLSLHIYHPTEYYYFKDTMMLKEPEFYYGLSWGALCGSGVIFSLLGSYYYDRTSDIRQLFLFTNFVSVLGNIFYLIYFSPYIVLLGQVFIGMAASRGSAGIGEISQIYESDVLTQKVSLTAIFSCIGGVLGPVSTFAFKLVDTEIDGWILDVNNMVGLVMGIFFVAYSIMNFFTLRNVAKERNLKKEIADNIRKELLPNNENEMNNLPKELESRGVDDMSFCQKYTFTVKALLRNKEAIFLYWLSFFTSFSRATLMMLIPIKSAQYLNWEQIDIATVSLASILGSAFPTAILFSIMSKVADDFYLLVISKLTLMIALVPMLLVYYIPGKTFLVAMFYCTGFFTIGSATAFHIISRAMLARMVPHNIQAITDAIRNILFELSYMSAGLAIKLSATYMAEFLIAIISLLTLSTLWLIIQHKNFKNMKTLNLYI